MRQTMLQKFVRGCVAENRPPATPEAQAALEAARRCRCFLLTSVDPEITFGAPEKRLMDGESRALSAVVDAALARQRQSKGLLARATDETVTADAPSRRKAHAGLMLALDGRG